VIDVTGNSTSVMANMAILSFKFKHFWEIHDAKPYAILPDGRTVYERLREQRVALPPYGGAGP
jgi:uncharacterized membrane protein YcaP (DUF421 family)